MGRRVENRTTRKALKKPSGTAGPFIIRKGLRAALGAQSKIPWPDTQDGIEWKVFCYFKREVEKIAGGKLGKVTECGGKTAAAMCGAAFVADRPDFLLEVPGGKTYLELMEAVLPDDGQNPHRAGVQWHSPRDYAEKVWKKVNRKIQLYGFRHTIPMDLLIYTTHEQYAPTEAAIQILRDYFEDRPHPFSCVSFIVPLGEDLTPVRGLFLRNRRSQLPHRVESAGRGWVSLPAASFKLVMRASNEIK